MPGPSSFGAPRFRRSPSNSVACSNRLIHAAVRPHGITAGQFLALARIADRPGIHRAELARGLQLSPQAVGGLLGQLERKRLVDRTEAAPDRPVACTPTAEGRAVLDHAATDVERLYTQMLRRFRPNLANAFDAALRHVLIDLTREAHPGSP